jgi:hypothetical protein
MSEPMTQAFTTAFLTTCFNEGLDQSAAAALLQKESADRAKAAHPGFARGYDEAMKQAGFHPPMIKYAGPRIDRVVQMLRGVKNVFGGAGGLAMEGVKDVGRAGRKIAGPGNPESFLNKYPFPTFLAGTAAASAGTLGAVHLLGRDRDLTYPGSPFFPPSGYSPEGYKKEYDKMLHEVRGPGIAQHNKDYFGTYGRRKELEKAIAENRDYSGQAYQELQRLNADHRARGEARKGYFDQLGGSEAYNRDMLNRISKRQSELERQRTAWWAAPKRWWLKFRGQDPNQYFDRTIGSLEGSAARAQMEANLSRDQAGMLAGGYVGRKAPAPHESIDVLNKRFFPTY